MAITDPYCKSLMHFDGADESPDFIDEKGKIWTAHEGAHLNIDQYVSSPSSGHFDGVFSFIDTPDHVDFNFGEGRRRCLPGNSLETV